MKKLENADINIKNMTLEQQFYPKRTEQKYDFSNRQKQIAFNSRLYEQNEKPKQHLHQQNAFHPTSSTMGQWNKLLNRTSSSGFYTRLTKQAISYQGLKNNMRGVRTVLPNHPYGQPETPQFMKNMIVSWQREIQKQSKVIPF